MKIKEIKAKSSKSQLNELQLSSLLGDFGAAQMKQAFGGAGGRTKQDIMTQNIFIKNFVSNALSSLQTAVKGGIVDPKKTTPRKATDKDLDQTYKTMQPGDLGDFDLKDKMAKQKADQEQYRKDQEAANVAKARTAQAASNPENPEVSAAVDARMQRATQSQQNQTPPAASVSDRLDRAAAQRSQSPQTTKNTPSNKQELPNTSDRAPIQPTAQVSAIPQNRNVGPSKKKPEKKPVTRSVEPSGMNESTYANLNILFEAIIETVLPDESVMTVDQYLKDIWFPKYMKGVDLTANKQKIDQIIQQVADTYAKDSGRAALTQLANLSYAISPRKTKVEPKKKDKPAAPAAKDTQAPAKKEKQEEVSVGGKKWIKGPQGWVDENGEMASASMVQMIDQYKAMQSQGTEPSQPETEPKKQQELPFSGATTSGNVTTLKRTGTSESKKVKYKK